MKPIIETYANLVILFLVVFISVEILGCTIQITKAKEYQQNVKDRIECSYFNEDVINDCMAEATRLGYGLTIRDETIYADRQCWYIGLEYKTAVPLLGVVQTGTVEGYAR